MRSPQGRKIQPSGSVQGLREGNVELRVGVVNCIAGGETGDCASLAPDRDALVGGWGLRFIFYIRQLTYGASSDDVRIVRRLTYKARMLARHLIIRFGHSQWLRNKGQGAKAGCLKRQRLLFPFIVNGFGSGS